MWDVFGYVIVCNVFGSMVPSTAAQGLFGSLLGDNDNNNNPNMPLIGALGLGSNRDEQNRPNSNYNQYTNTNNNQYTNSNQNRGLLSALGVNTNFNRPTNNLDTFNRNPNTAQNNPSQNVNDLKNQMKDAENLLERLKEINRLKEQQKLEKEKENNQAQVNSGKDKTDTDNNNSNMAGDSQQNGVLKSLTKKKFYFMVNPVVPENESVKHHQTVYYTD